MVQNAVSVLRVACRKEQVCVAVGDTGDECGDSEEQGVSSPGC